MSQPRERYVLMLINDVFLSMASYALAFYIASRFGADANPFRNALMRSWYFVLVARPFCNWFFDLYTPQHATSMLSVFRANIYSTLFILVAIMFSFGVNWNALTIVSYPANALIIDFVLISLFTMTYRSLLTPVPQVPQQESPVAAVAEQSHEVIEPELPPETENRADG